MTATKKKTESFGENGGKVTLLLLIFDRHHPLRQNSHGYPGTRPNFKSELLNG